MLKKLTFCFLFLFLSVSVFYGQVGLSKSAEISILTCGKGGELYSLYGHTAIRIQDNVNALDVVYNYGTFDFGTENFYLKFIKGDLQYFVTANSFNEFYYQYTIENRTIYEQNLNLSEFQKQKLFDSLNQNLLIDKKYYTYKFIDRNCTNMVVDKINKTLGSQYIVKTTEKDKTYREILFSYQKEHFYENLGINIIFGRKVDQDGKRLFLPNQFMESLKVTKFNKVPLSEKPRIILKATDIASENSIWNSIYSFIAVLLVLVLSRKTSIYISFLGVLGAIGILLSLVGFYSLHEEVRYNYNILLFNPLLLVLIFFYFKKNYTWVKKMAIICLILLGTYTGLLLNKPNLMMFIPLLLSTIIILYIFIRKSNKTLLTSVK